MGDPNRFFYPPVDSFVGAPPSEEESPTGKGKNKGSGKSRVRAKEKLNMKAKSYTGAVTRRRQKQLENDEKTMNRSMKKLVDTKLLNRKMSDNESDSQEAEDESSTGVIGNFSADDLVRQGVAGRESFEEPHSTEETENEETSNNPATHAQESSSGWSISLNPFSYYRRRSETHQPDDGGLSATNPNTTGRIDSITDEACKNPQHASTPN